MSKTVSPPPYKITVTDRLGNMSSAWSNWIRDLYDRIGGTVALSNVELATFVVPSGAILPFGGTTAPSGWLMCYGQAVSRSIYSDLFGAIGVTYGAGDGSTTFNVPDLRGRVIAGKDDMGGVSASRLTATGGITGTTLGASGGSETHTLLSTEMPSHTHIQDSHNHTQDAHTHTQDSHNHTQDAHNHTVAVVRSGSAVGSSTAAAPPNNLGAADSSFTTTSTTATNQSATATNQNTTATNQATVATNQSAGGDGAHKNVQPTIIFNYMIKA